MHLESLVSPNDTIAAIASAVGSGGIGVIRISGKDALPVLEEIFVPLRSKQLLSHQVRFGTITQKNGDVLDEVLVLWMKEGSSFTGEHVVEIHGHGGKLNMMQLLRRVLEADVPIRMAEPGEFSRRAYLNGCMDLTKAEAISDLISATNEKSLAIARSHMKGSLRNQIVELTEKIVFLSAHVESWIDFPEEFDPALDQAVMNIQQQLEEVLHRVSALCKSYHSGKKINEGLNLLLLGKPNAGKSSLFNYFSGENRAIVTSLAGTTRDLLETQITLQNFQVTLFDSAGINTTLLRTSHTVDKNQTLQAHEEIEKQGVLKAIDTMERSDIVFFVVDASRNWSEEDEEIRRLLENKDYILVKNKIDLSSKQLAIPEDCVKKAKAVFETSCVTKDGMNLLVSWLEGYIEEQAPSNQVIITNERHFSALKTAEEALTKSLHQGFELGPEFMAEDLRSARKSLVEIVGNISSEEILDKIFSSFCIGK